MNRLDIFMHREASKPINAFVCVCVCVLVVIGRLRLSVFLGIFQRLMNIYS
jgi:hypothetical protein